MESSLLLVCFVFGTLIGSFLNVVIYRTHTGLGVSGRSRCFACNKTLRWWELVPVVSFILLRGRCARCRSRISLQYPAVEIAAGILFVYLGSNLTLIPIPTPAALFEFVTTAIIGCLLLVITVYDIKHKIIPDSLVYLFIVVAGARMAISLWYPSLSAVEFHLWDISAGPVLFLPFWFLWKVSQGRWMGLGDGKLAWGIGWLLGISQGASAIIGGFWLGAGFALALMFLMRVVPWVGLKSLPPRLTMKSEIPFAPFLIVSTVIVFCAGWDLFVLTLITY